MKRSEFFQRAVLQGLSTNFADIIARAEIIIELMDKHKDNVWAPEEDDKIKINAKENKKFDWTPKWEEDFKNPYE